MSVTLAIINGTKLIVYFLCSRHVIDKLDHNHMLHLKNRRNNQELMFSPKLHPQKRKKNKLVKKRDRE